MINKFYTQPLTREQAYQKLGFTMDISMCENYLDSFIDGYEACKSDFRAKNNLFNCKNVGAWDNKLKKLNEQYPKDFLKEFGDTKTRFISPISYNNLYHVSAYIINQRMSREQFLKNSLTAFCNGRLF